ncbi:MAG: hypothetical protein CFH44_00054 [Proteobacteria bacterium]|nr:MAG: hypothetical protein CFH44_00054 [Pseudomonadota bacterium]
MRNKKILIAIISTLLVIATIYTAIWFIAKNKVEGYFKETVYNLQHQEKIKSTSYELTTSCFPFLCVELKNVRVQSKKYFSISKEGIIFEAFKAHPLRYETNNIFNTNFKFSEIATEYDFYSTNLDNNKTVKFILNIDEIELLVNKTNADLRLSGLTLQAESTKVPMFALIDIEELKASKEMTTNNDLTNTVITYNLNDVVLFDKKSGSVKSKIKHSTSNIEIVNVDKDFIKKAKLSTNGRKQFVEQAVTDMAKNGTAVKVNDFRVMTDNTQIIFNGEIKIDEKFFLNTNANAIFKFEKEGSIVEKALKKYQFKQNKQGSFPISVRTNNNIITVNNHIQIPTPSFKPEKVEEK